MALADRQVTYEVHVRQGGRWVIQARYEDGRERAAIEEATQLAGTPGIAETKVVRESYDDETGTSHETTVYKSPPKSEHGPAPAPPPPRKAQPPAPPPPAADKPPPPPSVEPEPAAAPPPAPKRPKVERGPSEDAWSEFEADEGGTSTAGVVTKIGLITLFSVSTATLATMLTGHYLGHIVLAGYDLGDTKTLFTLFIAVFLLTAVPTSLIFLSKENLEGGSASARRRPRKAAPAAKAKAKPAATGSPQPAAGGAQSATSGAGAAAGDGEAWRDKLMDIEVEPASAEDALDRASERLAEADAKAAGAEAPGADAALDEPGPKPAGEEEPAAIPEPPLAPAAETQKVTALKFLSQCLGAIDTRKIKMDGHNKFGVSLFLAGGCEVLCHERDLDAKTTERVLADCAEVIGYPKDRARDFAARYEDYLLRDPRYMQMFQAGRTAMKAALENEAEGPRHMARAMEEWDKPQQPDQLPGPVTVMFTDMVGSTKMTQERGDAVAQEVVRTHNRIVREALAVYNGKEIKHTGDGIMASFAHTSQSVEAAIFIQSQAAAHTRGVPDLPLNLKIGINAGEPIAEDDDLFGSTVQLAARIVDKAQSGQIFVSEIVRGICAGKNFRFQSRGAYEMKGFGDPLTLYEVLWRTDGAGAESAAE